MMRAFLLGLAVGPTCLAYCAPALTPYLLAEGKSVRRSAAVLAQFLGGRLCGYLLFAVLAWWLHEAVVVRTGGRNFAAGLVFVVLAGLLACYALVPGTPVCAARRIPAAWQQRFPLVLPAAMGFLTGVNLCPPFVGALAEAGADGESPAKRGVLLRLFPGHGRLLPARSLVGSLGPHPRAQDRRAVVGTCHGGLLWLSWNRAPCRRAPHVSCAIQPQPKPEQRLPFGKALLLCVPMLALTAMLALGRPHEPGRPSDRAMVAGVAAACLFVNAIFFLMIYTGRTARYRRIFFVTLSAAFVIQFLTNLIELRGTMGLSPEHMMEGRTPFCHMVIPMIIIPAALTRTVIFPGSLLTGFAPIAGMLVIWMGASLALGRGWCSWACFFGGMDEGFSRVLRRPVVRRIDRKWTYLNFAVLLAVVLVSAATLAPAYCEWLCPFKTVTEFPQVDSPLRAVQAVIFVSLFAGLVVVLPALTRRRTQCGLFCPMGAFQSFTNPINAFDIRIDGRRCTSCGRCIRACPTFSLDETSVAQGRARITCAKCGQCVDECPKGAAAFHVRGTAAGSRPALARLLFLYPAFLFGAIFALGMVPMAIWRIWRFVSTGSMI